MVVDGLSDLSSNVRYRKALIPTEQIKQGPLSGTGEFCLLIKG